MTRTYGKLMLGTDRRTETRVWGITCEPHVMLRLKRWFPKVQTWRSGLVSVADTLDVARDLEAFLARFPLETAPEVAAHLRERCAESRAREAAVLEVLNGKLRLTYPDDRKPIRALYDYQEVARDFGWTAKRFLLGDAVAMGKTTSALAMLQRPECLPAVFVTLTRPLPEQMMGEAAKVFPWLTGHVPTRGTFLDPTSEETPKRRRMDEWPDVTYLSYSKLDGWAEGLAQRGIRTVFFDEVQELRREDSNKYRAAGRLADAAEYVVGLSATPVYNYGGETFNIMEIIAPGSLGTRSEFSTEWGAGRGSSGDGMGGIKVGDPLGLGSYLRDQGLLLARTRKDVGRELPPVALVEHEIPSDSAQLDKIGAELADLAQLIFDQATDRKVRYTASGEISWRLRQQTGIAKAPYVAEFVKLLLESEDKVLVYVWHRAVYDILMRKLRDFQPVMYSGSESPTQKAAAKAKFLQPTVQGGSRVLLMSLRSGAGMDGLQDVAEVVVFGELDWSPQMHRQAYGRVDRPRADGQRNNVVAYFLHTADGSDPELMEVLDVKAMQNDPMIDPNAAAIVTSDADSGDRVRRLAAAALRRAGRPVPMALEGPHAPTPEDVAGAFAGVAAPEEPPTEGQMGLFG